MKNKITSESFAKSINGKNFNQEIISKNEELIAKENNLIIVYGIYDDQIEFRGKFHLDIEVSEGGAIGFNKDGSSYNDDLELIFDKEIFQKTNFPFKTDPKNPNMISFNWCHDERASWEFSTNFKHSKFNIYDDNKDIYCIGIVFNTEDLKEKNIKSSNAFQFFEV